MQSHCLKHQERIATHRCKACSKPLCEDCIQTYPDGIYCGEACHNSAAEATERLAQIRKDEKALSEREQMAFLIKLIVFVVVTAGLFFGWDSLPTAFTGKVEGLWHSIIKAF